MFLEGCVVPSSAVPVSRWSQKKKQKQLRRFAILLVILSMEREKRPRILNRSIRDLPAEAVCIAPAKTKNGRRGSRRALTRSCHTDSDRNQMHVDTRGHESALRVAGLGTHSVLVIYTCNLYSVGSPTFPYSKTKMTAGEDAAHFEIEKSSVWNALPSTSLTDACTSREKRRERGARARCRKARSACINRVSVCVLLWSYVVPSRCPREPESIPALGTRLPHEFGALLMLFSTASYSDATKI